jgi:MATE family multidrug resistance protein
MSLHAIRLLKVFDGRSDFKDTTRLAAPVVIGQLGHMMMGVVDSVMVGRVGAAPLAAASIGHSMFILVLIFGIGVSMAISPLVAMAVGAGNDTDAGKIFRQGLLVNTMLGLILAISGYFLSDIFFFLDQPPDVTLLAVEYMQILALSVIPVMIFQTYRQFSEGLAIMKPAMVVTVLANFVNVFVNWILIFGNLGAPALGLAGAGWATFCTRTLMAFALALYIGKASRFKQFNPSLRFKSIDMQIIKRVLRIGVPSGVQYVFEVGAFTGSAIIIGWLGTVPLAAHQIALNLASISFMFALGISSAASIRVGNAVGRKDKHSIRLAGFSAIILACAVMGTFGILFITLRYFLPSLYIDDSSVIGVAASLLIIAALFQLSDGTQAVGIGALRGMADTRIPMVITFIAYWIIGLPGGYLLGFTFEMGVVGVWVALLCALTASALMLSVRFNIKSRHEISL